jgi:hypothetical protein
MQYATGLDDTMPSPEKKSGSANRGEGTRTTEIGSDLRMPTIDIQLVPCG